MATNPAPTPAYKRVQAPSESLDGIACVSMISGKPLAEVLAAAVQQFKLRPTNGPYFIDEGRLQILLVKFGFVGKSFHKMTVINELPALAIVWQETDHDMEVGRHLLFHRVKDFADPKKNYTYVIDPMPQTDPSLGIRTDIPALELSWYMAVAPIGKVPATK
jgi:hypothetical protein